MNGMEQFDADLAERKAINKYLSSLYHHISTWKTLNARWNLGGWESAPHDPGRK